MGPGARDRRRPAGDPLVKAAVVGAGSWGTAVAAIVAGHSECTLWARDPQLAAAIDSEHENARYLPGIALPEALHATHDLQAACADVDAVVVGVPSHGFRTNTHGSHAERGITVTSGNSCSAFLGRSPPRNVCVSRTISPRFS